jgi:hypothetical protein
MFHTLSLTKISLKGKETVYRLVHSSVTVTMDRYAHVLPDQSAEYIEKAQPNFSLKLG